MTMPTTIIQGKPSNRQHRLWFDDATFIYELTPWTCWNPCPRGCLSRLTTFRAARCRVRRMYHLEKVVLAEHNRPKVICHVESTRYLHSQLLKVIPNSNAGPNRLRDGDRFTSVNFKLENCLIIFRKKYKYKIIFTSSVNNGR